MDPTVAKGTVFTNSKCPNHVISDGWKEVVMKEIAQTQAWKKKYAKHVLEDEDRLLLMSTGPSWGSQSTRSLGSSSTLSETQNSLREDGRRSYLSNRRKFSPQSKFTRPLTSAQEYGWRTDPTLGTDGVMFETSTWGRRPIVSADGSSSVESSFSRNCGIGLAPL